MKIDEYTIVKSKIDKNLYKVSYTPSNGEMSKSTILEEKELEQLLSLSFFNGGRFTILDDHDDYQDPKILLQYLDYFD